MLYLAGTRRAPGVRWAPGLGAGFGAAARGGLHRGQVWRRVSREIRKGRGWASVTWLGVMWLGVGHVAGRHVAGRHVAGRH
eukprot:271732-Prymnesium_polylepis.1